mgnify:CR=1 FL=1
MPEIKIDHKVYNLFLSENIENSVYKQVFCEKLFTAEECDKIISVFKNGRQCTSQEVSRNESGYTTPDMTNSKIHPFENSSENKWITDRVSKVIKKVNLKYFKYNISYLSSLQIIEYKEGCDFKWHSDIIPNAYRTARLSISLFLSEATDYEGGKLLFMPSDSELSKITQSRGTLMIFSSTQAHSVEMVKKGTRYSMVGFVYGKPFS